MTDEKRRYTRLTGDDRVVARKVAADLYRAGASIDEVAAELTRRGVGVSHGLVHALLVEAGEPRRTNARRKPAGLRQTGAAS